VTGRLRRFDLADRPGETICAVTGIDQRLDQRIGVALDNLPRPQVGKVRRHLLAAKIGISRGDCALVSASFDTAML
jgi:hypothetical protein